ncbi:MAG: pilus assembly protein, partial [Acidimicrobiia bacterium]|nr:pilus assembly protein [Acidimicrobiia bacterium]
MRKRPWFSLRRRAQSERGASLVEAALVVPLLILLAFGAAEFGFVFLDFLNVASAAREGARVGSAVGDAIDADTLMLNAIAEATADLDNSTIEAIWIFETKANGDPVDNCVVDSTLNYFTCVGPTNNTNIYDSSGNLLIGSWNSTGRRVTVGLNCPLTPAECPDRLGVRVVFTHQYITGFLSFPT